MTGAGACTLTGPDCGPGSVAACTGERRMGDDHYTLDELAAAAGMTARNVRAYQTRGLIPPPHRRGRRVVYGPVHLARLLAVNRARARGASLVLIREHLAAGGTLDGRSHPTSWLRSADGRPARPRDGDPPRSAPLSPLLAQLDPNHDPVAGPLLERLIATGVVHREGADLTAGPELIAGLSSLHRHGLPLPAALRLAATAAEAAAGLADELRPDDGLRRPDGLQPSDGSRPPGGRRPLDEFRREDGLAELVADLVAGIIREQLPDRLRRLGQPR